MWLNVIFGMTSLPILRLYTYAFAVVTLMLLSLTMVPQVSL